MKKFLMYFLVALLATACGIYALIHQKASQTHAPALVGEETLLFLHCPDIRQSRARWKKTALHQIANEPDVQAFLQKPQAQLPKADELRSHLRDFVLADPREAFFALESVSKVPVFVAGALCLGEKDKVDSTLAELAQNLQQQWPQGQKGETRYSGVRIQTFTQGKSVMASAWVGRWILVGDDLELIKKTIDRAQRSSAHGLLEENPDFQKARGHMPKQPEVIGYLRPEALVQGLSARGIRPELMQNAMEDVKETKAVCMGMKFDGENIRDAFYALSSHPVQAPQLSFQTQQLTTKDTIIYLTGLLDLNRTSQRIAKMSTPALPLALAALQAHFANQGITLDGLTSMLGKEYGVAVDWPAAQAQPSLLLSVDLRDSTMAAKMAGQLTNGQFGESWVHTQEAGIDLFTLNGLPLATPTLAVTDKKLLFGSDSALVKQALAPGAGSLQESPNFTKTEKLLAKPTQSFGYIDAAALFERVYSTSRPLLMMVGGLNPSIRNAVDVNKLPPTEAISKHLRPIAYSSSTLPDGFLVESIGPVTFTQAVVAAGIGVGAAILPMAKPYIAAAATPYPTLLPRSPAPAAFPVSHSPLNQAAKTTGTADLSL